MDPLKTVYVSGLPNADPNDIQRALRLFGPITWEPVRDEQELAEGFMQFRGPSEMKVATEILKGVTVDGQPVSLAIQPKTQSWMDSTARNASVDSVLKMSKSTAISRIQNGLKAVHSRSNEPRSSSENISIEEDGTLAEGDVPSGLLPDIRRHILRFRKESVEWQKRKRAIVQQNMEARSRIAAENNEQGDSADNDSALREFIESLESRVWEPSTPADDILPAPDKRQEMLEAWEPARKRMLEVVETTHLANIMPPTTGQKEKRYEQMLQTAAEIDPRAKVALLKRLHAERKSDDTETGKELELFPTVEPPTGERKELVSDSIDWALVTSDWIQTTLHQLIEDLVVEYFGVPENSLIVFMEEKLASHTDQSALIESLKNTLDEEAPEFVEKIWAKLPRSGQK